MNTEFSFSLAIRSMTIVVLISSCAFVQELYGQIEMGVTTSSGSCQCSIDPATIDLSSEDEVFTYTTLFTTPTNFFDSPIQGWSNSTLAGDGSGLSAIPTDRASALAATHVSPASVGNASFLGFNNTGFWADWVFTFDQPRNISEIVFWIPEVDMAPFGDGPIKSGTITYSCGGVPVTQAFDLGCPSPDAKVLTLTTPIINATSITIDVKEVWGEVSGDTWSVQGAVDDPSDGCTTHNVYDDDNIDEIIFSYSLNLGEIRFISPTGAGITDPADLIIASCTLDTDGDGISDFLDLDDDNDGILDLIEDYAPDCTITPSSTDPNFVSTPAFASANLPALTSPSAWVPLVANTNQYAGMLFTSPREIFEVTTKGREGSNQWVTTYELQGTKDGTNWINIGYYTGNVDNSSPVTNIVSNTDTDWLGLRIHPLTWVGYPSLRFGIFACSPLAQADSDGIPNSLDTDSDNDGCPDAIEGGGSFTDTDVTTAGGTLTDGNGDGANTNLGNTVDTDPASAAYGVPTTAGAGQTVGDSQDADVQSADCPVDCGMVDTDGDGIFDLCDLDDDNDGILDVDECSSSALATNALTFPTGSLPGGITYSYSGNTANVTEYSPGDIYVAGADPGVTITFSQPVIFTVTNPENQPPATITGGQTILSWGPRIIEFTANTGTWDFVPGTFTGFTPCINGSVLTREPNDGCTIGGNFNATDDWGTATIEGITTLTFTGDNREAYRFLVSPVGDCPDTDDDGIVDSLDTDSDNDGCPDAIEGGGSFTDTDVTTAGGTLTDGNGDGANTNLGNTVDMDPASASYGVPTTAGAGQTVGDSQDADVQSADCPVDCGMVDTDGDGIFDLCDLDDDNDGILDTDEGCEIVNTDMRALTWTGDATMSVSATDGTTLVGASTSGWKTSLSDQVFTLPLEVSFTYTVAAGNTMFGFAPEGSALNNNWNIDSAYGFYISGTSTYRRTGTAISIEQNSTLGLTHRITIDAAGNLTLYIDDVIVYTEAGLPTDNYQFYVATRDSPDKPIEDISFAANGNPAICLLDTDDDGIPNGLDLDSDGDGCYDSYEAGVTGATNDGSVTDSLAATTNAEVGNNGYANSLETAEDGVATYTSNYDPYAIRDDINACADTDGDGIADVDDLDDDNDGILDIDEDIMACSSFGTIDITGTGGNVVLGSTTVNYTISNTGTPDLLGGSETYDGIAWDNRFRWAQPWDDYEVTTITFSQPVNRLVVFAGDMADDDPGYVEVVGTHARILSAAGPTVPGGVYVSASGDRVYSNHLGNKAIIEFIDPYGRTEWNIGWNNDQRNSNSNTGTDYGAYAICEAALGLVDTDDDGIVNSLDTDSDNDGCPDAIEGGGSFTITDVTTAGGTLTDGNGDGANTNLGNTVDTDPASASYGVPTTAGAGQTVGDSQDADVQSADCPVDCGMVDTDGDGVFDLCDLDDDNDGILDIFEQLCEEAAIGDPYADVVIEYSPVGTIAIDRTNPENALGAPDNASGQTNWTTLGTSGGYLILGFTDNNFSNSGDSQIDFRGYEIGAVESANILGRPDATTKALLDIQGFITADPDGFYPLGQFSGSSAGIDIDAATNNAFPALTLKFNQVKILSTINSGDGADIDAVEALFSTGPCTCVDQDTDDDGIVDSLDTDSDNDGCPDAIEGGGSFTDTDVTTAGGTLTDGNGDGANTNLGNTVDTDPASATYGVPTTAGAGQTVGDSQDADVQSADCPVDCGMVDTDGDGIFDLCDLDDDNDGILDVLEQLCEEDPAFIGGDPYADVVIEYSPVGTIAVAKTNPQNAVGAPDDASGQTNYTAIGQNGGYIILGFTDNNFSNSGDSQIDFIGYEIGFVEEANIAGRPDAATKALLDSQGFITPDPDGFYPLGQFSGSSAGIDIDAATANAFPAFTLKFDQVKIFSTTTTGDGADIDAVEALFSTGPCTCVDQDTDDDGIVDSLDTDSDNDGCPDAIEGGGSFTLTDVTTAGGTLTDGNGDGANTNLGNTVDTEPASASYGVPTTAGAGQTVGDSQDAAVQSADCTLLENTITLCTDGIDNDNDGVSDCDDPNCAVFNLDQFTNADFAYWNLTNNYSGTFSDGTNWTYSAVLNSNGGGANNIQTPFDNVANFPTEYQLMPNAAAFERVFEVSEAATVTVTFDQPITNPYILIGELGDNGADHRAIFGEPVEVFWSENITIDSPTQVTGNNGNIIVKYTGTHSSVSVNFIDGRVNNTNGLSFTVLNGPYCFDPTPVSLEPCDDASLTAADICAAITADPTSPMASADCDGDGETNAMECTNGTDPTDPCSNSYATGTDICTAITAGATDLGTADCDGAGEDNATECANGTDPTNPCDDAGLTAADICAAITADPTSVMASADCDGDGELNETECTNGTDPLDPCSNSYADGAAVCAAITNGATGFAAVDCDGGGVSDAQECADGTDPLDPCDDAGLTGADICADIAANGTMSIYSGLDCDGDGVFNDMECADGTDPSDPCSNSYADGAAVCAAIANGADGFDNVDCDGGGVSDAQECADGTDPLDPCDDMGLTGIDICADLSLNGTSSVFSGLDCDGDGQYNDAECANGTDPLDPCSNSYPDGTSVCAAIANGATGFAGQDCDGGGVTDIEECANGTDPTNPMDDCAALPNGMTSICELLDSDPTNPIGVEDCDGDGQSNTEECNNGTDPTDPCSNNYSNGAELCAAVSNGATAFANVDCDGGGVSDAQECADGTDPMDPCDDMGLTSSYVCADIVINGSMSPFFGADCDGGGVSDDQECADGTDPMDPCDDTGLTGSDICADITANGVNSPFMGIDCDGDGENNEEECTNGTDPLDPCSNSYADAAALCTAIANGADGFDTVDCDGGGVSDAQECADGTDPMDPCDDTGLTGADICADITANGVNSPFMGIDCDGDGENNEEECTNGTDPSDPCSNSYADGAALCTAIANGAVGFDNIDCDGGGVSDAQECADGTDPTDPCDDTGLTGGDICADIVANGALSQFVGIDCDGDGENNEEECTNGTDPLDPCSNSYADGAAVCTAITNGATGFAAVDCDGGGVSDAQECADGTDPLDPCDDAGLTGADICADIAANGTMSIYSGLDCDGDGVFNDMECADGTDPSDPCSNNYTDGAAVCAAIANGADGFDNVDCDGGGVSDAQECADGTDPMDPCDDAGLTGSDICADITTNGVNSPFMGIDCDGDGENNEEECTNGTDPLDPCSNSYADGAAVCAAITNGATGFAAADCDGGGVSDAQECADGTDPLDPCDDTGLTGADICADIAANGMSSPFMGQDCDGDGELNETECTNGTDPLDPCSNSYADGAAVCAAITNGATGFDNVDCDGGGVSDAQECADGTDPLDPCDDTGVTGADICADIAANGTMSIYSGLDCDGDGVFNDMECADGTDPSDPCSNSYADGAAVCAAIANGADGFDNVDCDGGGVSDAQECADGTDPLDPCDDMGLTGIDICADLSLNGTSSVFSGLDCDGDGQYNDAECANGTDPLDPCSNSYPDGTSVCAAIANGATGFAGQDCDGGGVTDIEECANGTDPTNPMDDCAALPNGMTSICELLDSDPTNPIGVEDCDGDGQSNTEECNNGTDPTDPCSNNYSNGAELCAAVSNGATAFANVDCDGGGVSDAQECADGTDPMDPCDDMGLTSSYVCADIVINGSMSPFFGADCDGGGVSDDQECADGTDPMDPCDDTGLTGSDICADITANGVNSPFMGIDCDGDGENNEEECTNGTDPLDPCSNSYADAAALCTAIANGADGFDTVDCDGGGVSDAQECADGTDPMDPCDDTGLTGADICADITANGVNSPFMGIDCDGDGENNEEECTNGTDPSDPCSNSYADGAALCTAIANGAVGFDNIDCDGGGVSDAQECADGTDPTDPCDDTGLTGGDICADIVANGALSQFVGIDCDGDGENNEEECTNGTDPLDPCSNSYADGAAVCTAITNGATGFAAVDCDGGGVSDAQECADGTDPLDPCDDAGLTGADICADIAANGTMSIYSGLDCDGDGVFNDMECADGTDPSDPCSNNYTDGAAVCAAIANGADGFDNVDCDGGGVSDAQECADGTDPMDPCDDAGLIGSGICADITTNGVNSPFMGIDCDGDGENNEEECTNGTDPLDPCSNSYADGAAVCAAIANGATGFAAADCDGGGVSDAQECADGTDPLDPCDDTGLTGADICADIAANGMSSPFMGQDCDGDGELNETECTNGTDPTDPCSNSYADGAAVCAAIANGADGFAAVDCDGGGVSDAQECADGTDPLDPCDDTGVTGADICADITANGISSIYSGLDCDGDGDSNDDECNNGTDPTDPCSNSYTDGVAVCAAIANGADGFDNVDCDGGGVSDAQECADGTDPFDPCDDMGLTGIDICADLSLNGTSSVFSGLDCDGDGQYNDAECANGTDPLDPCSNSYPDGTSVCAAIANGATGFAGQDCDGGGVTDIEECANGTDPTNPMDDCAALPNGMTSICELLDSDPTNPIGVEDCDGDGQSNTEECNNGTDPTDPCSNSYANGTELCAAVSNGATAFANVDCDGGGVSDAQECADGTDPMDPCDDMGLTSSYVCADIVINGSMSPFFGADCDGGGVSDDQECADGTDPMDPCDDTGLTGSDICASITANGVNSPFMGIDCDGDGENNEEECTNGTDPLDPCSNSYADAAALCTAIANGATGFAAVDCDGGGVSDAQECADGTDPMDPCDDAGLTGADICADITANGVNSPFMGIDCDGDGENNEEECTNGTDPSDPCSNSYADGAAICAAIANGATGFAAADCDGGGVSDAQECADGTDPTDPCDDTGLTGGDICADIVANGALSQFVGIDCDGDGENNEEECTNGTDPLDPCSNSYADGAAVCTAITNGATGFAAVDCDGGGVSDAQECADGTDPLDPCDDAGLTGADICADIAANGTMSIYSGLDCDGDGVFNDMECADGTDPSDPCSNNYTDGAAVCAAIANGADGFDNVDCDGGGVSDAQECADGTDPMDPCDDAGLTGSDICADITTNGVNSPFMGIDCDGDGENNEEECTNGTDPLDPCSNSYADGAAVCAAITNGATGFAAADCDGGGVSDAQECADGTDPLDPCDDASVTGATICAFITIEGSSSVFYGLDCDGDGELNEEECINGTDPLDPCSNSYADGSAVCTAILNGATGFADEDCDGGGVGDAQECADGTDPTDPCDDAGVTGATICAFITIEGSSSVFYGLDCDGDGELNEEECTNGTDPLDPCSNSYADGSAVCAAIANGATGFAAVDCDGGGVSDEQECTEGTDPTDPCDDAGVTGATICADIAANGSMSIYSGLDCDGDGENNEEECTNGTDPLDPCSNSYADGSAVCTAITNGATGFAAVDCDGGGVSDEQECADGTNPLDPCDDAGVTGADICADLAANGTMSIYSGLDCDGDGVFNDMECADGTDPSDPCSNSYTDGAAVCAAIANGATGFSAVDCDGGGVNDAQECADGTDPMDPCDDAGVTGSDICADITTNGVNSPFMGIDCDGDGENNEEECTNGTDPLDPCSNSYADGAAVCAAIANGATGFAALDCDGGGVTDAQECADGTDPTDPCDDAGVTGATICAFITIEGSSSVFYGLDCDGDGENNELECTNGTDPSDPCSNSYADAAALCTAIANGADGFDNVDCDGGGVSDAQECADGTDPTDPCDDAGLTGSDICADITANGANSVFMGIDCDGDGESNEEECTNGTDPSDPCSNSYAIGGQVFYDWDQNGCLDQTNETGAEDVAVYLYNCGEKDATPGNAIASDKTDDNGDYSFGSMEEGSAGICLHPDSTYYVVFDIPNATGESLAGFNFTLGDSATCAGDSNSDDVDPNTGQSDCYDATDDSEDDNAEDINVGITPCETLGGQVFYDWDQNGCLDQTDETGAEDVTVYLYNCSETDPTPDNAIASDTTDANGDYSFGNMEEGSAGICLHSDSTYYVVFDIPNDAGEELEGYDFTPGDSATCAGSPNSDDANYNTGQTDCYDPDNDDDDEHINVGVIPIVDVALIKTTTQTGPFRYEDVVTFDIEVFNQGMMGLFEVKVNDFIPCGYKYLSVNNADWGYDPFSSIATATIPYIGIGDSEVIQITLEIAPCTLAGAWYNIAEVEKFENEEGRDITIYDIDSYGDDNPGNDTTTDNEYDENGKNNGDEDDNDPEEIDVFDLALIKTVVSIGPYVTDSEVTYDIKVVNQGNMAAANVEIMDHLPPGLDFSAALNSGWSASGADAYAYTIPVVIQPGDEVNVPFIAILELLEITAENYTNIAEISDNTDENGGPVTDADSDPDSNPNNDGTPIDNQLNDKGDEDDHDPEVLNLTQDFPPDCAFECQIACVYEVNMSLDDSDCETELFPSSFIAGLDPACNSDDFYNLMLTDESGNIIDLSIVTSEHIGQKLTFKIINECQNSCWGYINVEYKQGPSIDCPPVVVTNCLAYDVSCPPAFPHVTPGCLAASTEIEIELVGENYTFFDCGDYTMEINRSYRAVDVYGNASFCDQVIRVEPVEGSNIYFPKDVEISCGDTEYSYDTNGIPMPWLPDYDNDIASGMPLYTFTERPTMVCSEDAIFANEDNSLFFIPISPDAGIPCNGIMTYRDIELPAGLCSRKIMRTWEYIQWSCGEAISENMLQVIELVDNEGPIITCPDGQELVAMTDCGAMITIPMASATDDCNADLRYTVKHPSGFSFDNGGVTELPLGTSLLTYVVYDGCDNSSSCQTEIFVSDNTLPVAVCDQNTIVTINQTGRSRVPAEVFDDGSLDDCDELVACVTRMDELEAFRSLTADRFIDYLKYVEKSRLTLACEQSEIEGVIIEGVEYISESDLCRPSVYFCCTDAAADQMVMFRVADPAGNTNQCMVNVTVKDIGLPVIACPEDITVNCLSDLTDLPGAYGVAALETNCNIEYPVTETIQNNLNTCAIGDIIREFTITDNSGTILGSCIQTVNVERVEILDPDLIIWPANFEADCSVGLANLIPDLLDDGFGNPVLPNASCTNLGVEYKDAFFSDLPSVGNCGKILREWTVIDWCNELSDGSFAIYRHSQTIKIGNAVGPTLTPKMDTIIVSNTADCGSIAVALNCVATDDCTVASELLYSYLLIYPDGQELLGSGSAFSEDLLQGEYDLIWTVQDACGNRTSATQHISVANNKAPTVYCKNGISVTIEEAWQEAKIAVSHIDAGSAPGCPGQTIELSFDPVQSVDSLRFDCSQLGIQTVTLYVRESLSGITSSCLAQVTVNDPHQVCTAQLVTVAGNISTEDLKEVEDVAVDLGSGNLISDTDGYGDYAFNDMPMGGSYNVTPFKNDEPLNGVSTLDLILIQRHILGIERLDSPYKLIAADVNNSKDVNGLDLVELRKLILGIYSEFPANTSWRFIDEGYAFLNELDPWLGTLDESYIINSLETDMDIDFIGVKIGDVNGTVVTNSMEEEIDTRSYRWPLTFEVPEMPLSAGTIVSVPVYGRHYERVSGWQLTFGFDAKDIEILEVVGKALDVTATNYNISSQDEGWMTMSYSNRKTQDVSNDKILFEILLRVENDINADKLLEINSEVTTSEAYRGYSELVDVQLASRSDTKVSIASVNPNPWIGQTQIAFHMPKAGPGRWSFYDLNGRMVYTKEGEYKKGANTMVLDREELGAAGIIYIKLTTDSGVVEYKMIVVR